MAHRGSSAWSTKTGIAAKPAGASYQWVGDSGAGGNGSWTTAADWDPASVPGASSTVTFATGDAGYTVLGDATVGAITVADTLTFDGAIAEGGNAATFLTGEASADLTLDANSVVTGNGIDFATGSLLDVQGLFTATGGTASTLIVEGLSGQAIFASAVTLDSLYVQTGGSFTGDVVLTDGGNITLDTSSSFGGNSITLLGSGSIYDALAPGAVSGEAGIGDAIAVGAGGTLSLGADPGVTLDVGGPISGAGNVLISGGTVQFTGVNDYTGSTTVQDGTLVAYGAGAVPPSTVTIDGMQEQASLVALDGGALVIQPDSTGATNFPVVVTGYGTSDTVDASAGGNALVFGGVAGIMDFIGGAGSSTLVGGAALLSVTGGAGSLAMFGGSGGVDYTGGTASSTIIGGSGAIHATGGTAGDVFFGGTSGQDVLNTGDGPSTLVGFVGAQLYATGASNSALVAGGGNVLLNASASSGNDTLYGGPAGGADTIYGGSGTDYVVLNGPGAGASAVFSGAQTDIFAGSGALTLAYDASMGNEVTNVLGFNVSQDNILLSGYAAGTAAQVLASETISGGNTILNVPGNDLVVLFGTTGLTAANFV